jgi:hypothetical protein
VSSEKKSWMFHANPYCSEFLGATTHHVVDIQDDSLAMNQGCGQYLAVATVVFGCETMKIQVARVRKHCKLMKVEFML